jgi:hypothetical protein
MPFSGHHFAAVMKCAPLPEFRDEAVGLFRDGETVRRTIIAPLVAGLTVLLAPAANAATRDLTDPAGDVMTATLNDANGHVTYHREGGAEGDITFARIQHTATQVVMYMRYRQLTVPKQYASFQYVVEGNNGRLAFVGIDTRHGQPQGAGFVFSSGRHCMASHHINYAADSVSVRIPVGCLKSPKYVRLTHLTYRFRGIGDVEKMYYDNPARDGGTLNQVQTTPTPWVVVG